MGRGGFPLGLPKATDGEGRLRGPRPSTMTVLGLAGCPAQNL